MPQKYDYFVEIRDKDNLEKNIHRKTLDGINEIIEWLSECDIKCGCVTIRNIIADKIPDKSKYYHIRVTRTPRPIINEGGCKSSRPLKSKLPEAPKIKIKMKERQ